MVSVNGTRRHLTLHAPLRARTALIGCVALCGLGLPVAVGQPAQADSGIESLRNCLATPKSELDVVVLMDKSGSMKKSDKSAARSTMVSTSLRLLANIASADHRYKARLISWGGKKDGPAPAVGWTEIDGEQDPDIQRLADSARANNARYTD